MFIIIPLVALKYKTNMKKKAQALEKSLCLGINYVVTESVAVAFGMEVVGLDGV